MTNNYFTTPLPECIAQADALSLQHFDYNLPPELVAQMPAAQRTASRLLVCGEGAVDDLDGGATQTGYGFLDAWFPEVLNLLRPDDVLILNNTKVIKARLFGTKATGGKVEVMLDRVLDVNECLAQIRASKAPQPGSVIQIGTTAYLTVMEKNDRFYRLASNEPILSILEQWGHLPLPPYIDHAADDFDAQRYQTVFAQKEGAVAAPTAGLHFDEPLLQAIEGKGVTLAEVTLHVGAGTFLPVSSADLSAHVMHQEYYEIPERTAQLINQARAQGRRVVAVGTTALRALESAYVAQNPSGDPNWQLQASAAQTRLFIRPPYRFGMVDVLLTNFHLPQSTLLMLVSALAGVAQIRAAYNHAIDHGYRFFSYGDAMWLPRVNVRDASDGAKQT